MTGFEVNNMAGPIKRFQAGSCALWDNEVKAKDTSKTVLKASII